MSDLVWKSHEYTYPPAMILGPMPSATLLEPLVGTGGFVRKASLLRRMQMLKPESLSTKIFAYTQADKKGIWLSFDPSIELSQLGNIISISA